MVAEVQSSNIIDDTSVIHQSIDLAEVGGGKETNPLWKSEIGNEEFSEALRQSLALHTLLSEKGGHYTLKASLLSVEQPFFGASFTVKTNVQYTLVDTKNQKTIFDKIIHAEYTAQFSDSFYGAKRLQLANEGAVKENISNFVTYLIEQSKNNPEFSRDGGLMISMVLN